MPFTCPEYLIEYSWHGENFSLRLFDLFVKTSTSISLYCSVHVRQCFSRKRQVTLPFACQQNICISICQAPEKLQFVCGSITHPGAVALPTPYSLLPSPHHSPRSCCGHSSSSSSWTFNVSHLKMHGTVRLNGRATIKCYDRCSLGWQHI